MFDNRTWRVLAKVCDSDKELRTLCSEYRNLAVTLVANKGLRTAVKVLKDILSSGKILAIQGKVVPKKYGGVSLKLYATGFPKALPSFNTLAGAGYGKTRFDYHRIQLALTVLAFVETITLPPVPSTEDIEKEFCGVISSYETFCEEFQTFVQKYFVKMLPEIKIGKPFHMGTKGGPQGYPNILRSGQNPHPILFGEFSAEIQWAMRALGRGDILKLAVGTWQALDFPLPKALHEKYIAVLIAFAEKAGKTRQVYAPSWYIQEALKEIHDYSYECLRSLYNYDGTFSHSSAGDQIKQWTKEGKPLWSFDLSAATDRFPLRLQVIVMEAIFGYQTAEAWRTLVSLPAYFKPIDRCVKWSVGQPMGLFSSWSIFSLTHHALLNFLKWKLGTKASYIIVGDDIVISDIILAQEYRALLTVLGVPINESKSVLHENSTRGSAAEFVKRLFVDGVEVTPLSGRLLKDIYTDRRYSLLYTLHKELKTKWGTVIDVVNQCEIGVRSPLNIFFSYIPPKRIKDIQLLLAFPTAQQVEVVREESDKNSTSLWNFDRAVLEKAYKRYNTDRLFDILRKVTLLMSMPYIPEGGESMSLPSPEGPLTPEGIKGWVPTHALARKARIHKRPQPFYASLDEIIDRRLTPLITSYNEEFRYFELDEIGMDLDNILSMFDGKRLYHNIREDVMYSEHEFRKAMSIHKMCIQFQRDADEDRLLESMTEEEREAYWDRVFASEDT